MTDYRFNAEHIASTIDIPIIQVGAGDIHALSHGTFWECRMHVLLWQKNDDRRGVRIEKKWSPSRVIIDIHVMMTLA